MTASALPLLTQGDGLHTVLLGAVRVVSYLGFVLLVGTGFFVTWLWPQGYELPTFRRLIYVGAVATVIASAVLPALDALDGLASYGGVAGACAIARIALVMIGVGFLPDVLRSAHRMRGVIVVWQLLMVETYVLSSDAWTEPWRWVKLLATTGHLFATAAWLGGLLVLATILVPSTGLNVLHGVLPKFSIVAIVSVVTLVVTGVLHALAVSNSVSDLMTSTYGTVLLLKAVIFAVMLALGNIGRRYAGRIGHRPVNEIDATSRPESVQAFAVAVGAEFTLAVGVLAATAALVHVAP